MNILVFYNAFLNFVYNCLCTIYFYRFSAVHLNGPMQYSFNRKEYNESLFTRLVPSCSQGMLQKQSHSNHMKQDVDLPCSDFLPSFSNHGICLTRNGATLDQIFKSNSHLSTFQSIFHPKQYHQKVQRISQDRSAHYFSFFLDGNTYKDLKRGMDWNISTNTEFNIGIHSPNDIADIRGWFNTIIKVRTGYITKLTIKLSQITSDESIRGIDIEKRGCRFTDENGELSSVNLYSKINCLLDCNMKFAENICGCRPWDYPTSDQENKTSIPHQLRMCDFYGSSCFNRALRQNMKSKCDRKCVPNCKEIDYSVAIEVEPIDPEKTICSYLDASKSITTMEFQIKKYVHALFSEQNWYGEVDYVSDSPPERRMLNLLTDILLNANESYHSDEKKVFESDCTTKLNSDIAAVIVNIGSPTFSRNIRSLKVSEFDKLATLGKFDVHWEDNYVF